MPTGSVHVFIPNAPNSFRNFVSGMQSLPPDQHWKILAMKTILEKFEKNFRELFADSQFVLAYGKILRAAYINYMPWYHRLFLLLNIYIFQDSAFKIAKANIQGKQKILGKLNHEKNRLLEQEIKTDKNEKLKRAKILSISNKIVEKLDFLYLTEKRIPGPGDVKILLPELDIDTFEQVLISEKFQMIPALKDSDAYQSILLYPMNYEWRTKAARLRRSMDIIFEEFKSPDLTDEQKKIVADAKRVVKYLNKAETSGGIPEDGEDPYKTFATELRKQDQKFEVNYDPDEELEV